MRVQCAIRILFSYVTKISIDLYTQHMNMTLKRHPKQKRTLFEKACST
jgi:hypothetical protein